MDEYSLWYWDMVIEFLIDIVTAIGWIVIAGMIATGLLHLGRMVYRAIFWDKEDEDHKKFCCDDKVDNHDHPWSTRMGKKDCLHYGYRKWGE